MNSPTGIIIPQYGQAELTLRCVESFLDVHTDPGSILVVDDGSAAPQAVRQLHALPAADLRILKLRENRGVTHAWSTAARELLAAQPVDHLVFLNNDVVSQGAWLPALLAGLQQPGVLLAGVATRQEPHLPAAIKQKWPQLRLLAGWCLAIRTVDFLQLGGFDPRLELYFSDTDLQLRALLAAGETAGPVLQSVPGLSLQHLLHGTVATHPARQQLWERDRSRFVAKWKNLMNLNT